MLDLMLIAAAGAVTPKPAPTPDGGTNFSLAQISWDGNRVWPRFYVAHNRNFAFPPTPLAIAVDTVTNSRVFILYNDDVIREFVLPDPGFTSNVETGISYNVGAIDNQASGITFGANGSKMYIHGSQVRQFDLSAPFDINTAQHVKSFDPRTITLVRNKSDVVRGLTFNNNGRKMYVTLSCFDLIGNFTYCVLQFGLSTPWEVDTARWDGQDEYPRLNLSVIPGTSNYTGYITGRGIKISNNGLHLYYYTETTGRLHQTTLTEAYNLGQITSSTYFTPNLGSVRDIYVNPDRTRLYIMKYNNGGLYQYNLPDPNDVSSAGYSGKTLSLGTGSATADRYSAAVSFSIDGSRMYVGGADSDFIYQFRLGNPWEIDSAVWRGADNISSVNMYSYQRQPLDVMWDPSGTRLFLTGSYAISTNGGRYGMHIFSTSTPYSLGSLQYVTFKSLYITNEQSPAHITFSPDGSNMYVGGNYRERIYQWSGPSWQPENMSYVGYIFVGNWIYSYYDIPRGIAWRPDGYRMYVASDEGRIYYGDATSPFDITTLKKLKTYATGIGNVNSLRFSPDGNRMYAATTTSAGGVKMHWLSRSYDPTSTYRTHLVYFRTVTPEFPQGSAYCQGVHINDEGDVLTMVEQGGRVYKFKLNTSWDLATISYGSSGDSDRYYTVITGNSTASIFNLVAMCFSDDGRYMYLMQHRQNDSYSTMITGGQHKINQYSLPTPWELKNVNFVATLTLSTNQIGYGVASGIDITSDGRYLIINGDKQITKLKLNTPFMISTAIFIPTSTKFNGTLPFTITTSNQSDTPHDLTMKPDNRRLIITARLNSALLLQYNLSTAGQINTAVYEKQKGVSYMIATEFDAGGENVYQLSTPGTTSSGLNHVTKVPLTTEWDVGTLQTPGTYNTVTQGRGFYNITYGFDRQNGKFKLTSAGDKLITIGSSSSYSYQVLTYWNLRSAFDVENPSYVRSATVPTISSTRVQGLAISHDGNLLFLASLSTPGVGARIESYVINRDSNPLLTYINRFLTAPETTPVAVSFRPDGGMMWILGASRRTIRTYILSTPYAVNSAVFVNEIGLSTGQGGNGPIDLVISAGGSRFVVADTTTTAGGRLHEYTLTRPYDMTSAQFVRSFNHFNISHYTERMGGFDISGNGKRLYISGRTGPNIGKIFTYTLAT